MLNFLSSLERDLEPFYQVVPWIAEFWNTMSNLGLILIAIYRLNTLELSPPDLQNSYWLVMAMGIGSAIHHAFPFYGSIVIDWIPILLFIIHSWIINLHHAVEKKNLFWLILASGWFFTDHLLRPCPTPWGHSIWHLLAAVAIDQLLLSWYHQYQEKRRV